MPTAPRIETGRLILTWPTAVQIDDFHDAIVGSDVFDTIAWDGPDGPDELHDFWGVCRANDPQDLTRPLDVAAIDRKSGRYLGGLSLRPLDGSPTTVDIGYAFAPHAQGKGYATEAVGALVDEAFALRDAQRVFATIFVGNTASRRVLDKVGFQFEGTVRRAALKYGQWRDEWLMAITRPDWESR